MFLPLTASYGYIDTQISLNVNRSITKSRIILTHHNRKDALESSQCKDTNSSLKACPMHFLIFKEHSVLPCFLQMVPLGNHPMHTTFPFTSPNLHSREFGGNPLKLTVMSDIIIPSMKHLTIAQ